MKLPLPENWKTIPYGRPLENQAYRVVDDFGRDCPFWVEGELWIGGEGVGKGYRGDEVLTKQKYIMDCFGRWYRTGDNGCFWNDGTIEYRGRRDFQVKVNGHRIELGEIEAILNKIAGVKKSIVCAVEHNNRKNMLVAVVVKESPNINEEFLMQNLKSKLPVYMLPTKIIFEDKLPVGKNAKQDRKEVVRWIKAHEDRNIENEEKLTPCETRMLKIWKRLLGNDNITKKDNYFVCGGDSLLAVRMTAEIEAEFGEMWKVMLEHDFFVAEGQHFTVEEMESKIGVADKYKRFFRRWLKIFENENFIKEEQDGFCRTSKSWKVDVAAEWDYLWGVEKQLNYGEGFVRYLEKCSKSLTQLFRNEIAPLELLFPHGEMTTAVDTYQKTLSRNTGYTLKYVRMLKERNIAVYFEVEKINTLKDGEFLMTILSSVAQQEVENTSAYVKKGLKMKMKRGELVGFQGCMAVCESYERW